MVDAGPEPTYDEDMRVRPPPLPGFGHPLTKLSGSAHVRAYTMSTEVSSTGPFLF